MASLTVLHEKCDFIKRFIEDDLLMDYLVDINFCDQNTFNKVIKLGFDPNKWELRYPYSKILVEGKPYLDVT